MSAAFDTIDHSTLLKSHWFGITDTACPCFESNLTPRSFSVMYNRHKSPSIPLSFGGPQGSVLGPLLFIMYTTPVSTLLYGTSVDHHIHAEDTRIFIFRHFILVHRSTSSEISSPMFQLGCMPTFSNQREKASIVTLATYAHNLGFLIHNNLTLDQHISALLSHSHASTTL
jgi:hypothetical protein